MEAIPEECFSDIDSVIGGIILLDKIERRLDDLKKGDVLSEEDIDKEIEKW